MIDDWHQSYMADDLWNYVYSQSFSGLLELIVECLRGSENLDMIEKATMTLSLAVKDSDAKHILSTDFHLGNHHILLLIDSELLSFQ